MKTIFNFDLLSKILIFSLALSSLGCGAKKLSEKPLQWNPLFNGKDLENWQVKLTGHELNENYGNTFRVEDGLLKVRYDKYDDGLDRQRVVYGKSVSGRVDLGGRRIIKKKKDKKSR